MSVVQGIFSGMWLLLAVPSLQQENVWRGIIPLHSTRADVERVLGRPSEPTGSSYNLSEESIVVVYASGAPCGGSGRGGWRVPRDTVISLTLYPRLRPQFAELQIDRSKYERREGGHLPDVFYFVNEKVGVKFEVVQGKLAATTYFPAAKDVRLRCPEPVKPQRLFANGELTAAGKELLDGFMRRLGQEPNVTGWIKVDLETVGVDEAAARGDCVAKYLRTIFGEEAKRVTITTGSGMQQEMELFVMPRGGDPVPFTVATSTGPPGDLSHEVGPAEAMPKARHIVD